MGAERKGYVVLQRPCRLSQPRKLGCRVWRLLNVLRPWCLRPFPYVERRTGNAERSWKGQEEGRQGYERRREEKGKHQTFTIRFGKLSRPCCAHNGELFSVRRCRFKPRRRCIVLPSCLWRRLRPLETRFERGQDANRNERSGWRFAGSRQGLQEPLPLCSQWYQEGRPCQAVKLKHQLWSSLRLQALPRTRIHLQPRMATSEG